MEPRGISPGRQEHHGCEAVFGLLVRLLHPCTEAAAVRRVEPANAAPLHPGLRERIECGRDVDRQLPVCPECSQVDIETEDPVVMVKQFRWCFPHGRVRREHCRVQHLESTCGLVAGRNCTGFCETPTRQPKTPGSQRCARGVGEHRPRVGVSLSTPPRLMLRALRRPRYSTHTWRASYWRGPGGEPRKGGGREEVEVQARGTTLPLARVTPEE